MRYPVSSSRPQISRVLMSADRIMPSLIAQKAPLCSRHSSFQKGKEKRFNICLTGESHDSHLKKRTPSPPAVPTYDNDFHSFLLFAFTYVVGECSYLSLLLSTSSYILSCREEKNCSCNAKSVFLSSLR